MAPRIGAFIIAAVLGLMAFPALSQMEQFTLGGDRFGAGEQTGIETAVQGDAFVAGSDVALSAPVQGSAHMLGFTVTSNAAVGDDFYGAGFTVNVNAPVAGNVSAAGRTVTLARAATVGGNARLAGASVSLASPVDGAVLVSAETLTLSGTIGGDFSFFGQTINFGPDARIAGAVDIHAPEPIAVPEHVAPTDRVSFATLTDSYADHAGRTAASVFRGFGPMVAGLMMLLAALIAIGAVLMAFFPRRLATMQAVADAHPLRALGWGALTFAMLLGLVPLFALSIVGLLIVPFVIVGIVICLGLAFVLGAYLLGTRVAASFVVIDTNLKRLGVMAASLLVAFLLGMIPFLGWGLSLLITTFGLGAIVGSLLSADPRERIANVTAPPQTPASV